MRPGASPRTHLTVALVATALLPVAGGAPVTAQPTDPQGWVRLAGLAWPPQRQMAYLATTVTSTSVQPVALRVGAAQVARVWLNGKEVLTTPQPLERAPDQVAGGGWLREGANSVVVADPSMTIPSPCVSCA